MEMAALLEIKTYEGLQGPFSLDAYGDPMRPLCVLTIKDGAYVPLGEIELALD